MISDIKHQMRNGHIITRLMIVNIGVFVIQSILLLFFQLSGKRYVFDAFIQHFYFPKNVDSFLHQPWTIITYQFFHDPAGILHIFFNMLYLYFFGRILIGFLNRKFVLPLYLTGGIAGAILFMVTYNLSPAFQTSEALLLGASASILAIVVAAATLVPNYTVFLFLIGPAKLKYLALIAVLIDIVSISAGDNAGGHIAHLGGALTGYLYVISYQKGNNWFAWWPRFEEKIAGLFKRKKPKVVYINQKPSQPPEKKKKSADTQKQMDAILDKIAQSGYESLTKSEKEFLFKISNEKE